MVMVHVHYCKNTLKIEFEFQYTRVQGPTNLEILYLSLVDLPTCKLIKGCEILKCHGIS